MDYSNLCGAGLKLSCCSGLKNDSMRETFRVRHTLNGQFFPIRFLKIVPLQSWGPSFNFSIWYVALAGDDSDDTVKPAIAWHEEVSRLCGFLSHSYLTSNER